MASSRWHNRRLKEIKVPTFGSTPEARSITAASCLIYLSTAAIIAYTYCIYSGGFSDAYWAIPPPWPTVIVRLTAVYRLKAMLTAIRTSLQSQNEEQSLWQHLKKIVNPLLNQNSGFHITP